MVDKLKDAAMLFKAKITKDEIEALMIEATSEDNWQTPTTILHQIANSAYNHEDWKKIEEFLMDKLKSKKWKKILKALSVVEFLLKNGPSGILYDLKSELYMYKGFETYTFTSEGIDRGEAIRQKAKQVVELLVNQEYLDEERAKAQNIKEKMGLSNTYSNARYEGPSSKSTSYSGSSGSSYQGMGSDQQYDAKKGRDYDDKPKQGSYADKFKGGLSQVSDMIKTAYNKTNFNDFGGYIKDKVTSKDVKQRQGLLEDDSPPFEKKPSNDGGEFGNFTEYKPPPPSNATGSPNGGGLFKNLNVKATSGTKTTTTSNIQKPASTSATTTTSKQTTTSNISSGKKNQPTTQSADIFSFDDQPKAVQPSTKPVASQPIDIFADFGSTPSVPKVTPPAPPTNHSFGPDIMFAASHTAPPQVSYNVGLLGVGAVHSQPTQPQPYAPQPNISMGTPSYSYTAASNPVHQPASTGKPDVKWLSSQETNLIDFSDMTGNNSKGTATKTSSSGTATYSEPSLSYLPSPAPAPAYQPQGYGGMQYYPQQAQQMMPPQPQFSIPASQYQQFQQFLQFQQQQTLKH